MQCTGFTASFSVAKMCKVAVKCRCICLTWIRLAQLNDTVHGHLQVHMGLFDVGKRRQVPQQALLPDETPHFGLALSVVQDGCFA